MTWYRLLLLIAQVDSFLNDLNHYQLILIAPLYCLCYSDVRRGRSRLCSEQHGQYMSTCSIGIFEVSITKIQNVECYVILICVSRCRPASSCPRSTGPRPLSCPSSRTLRAPCPLRIYSPTGTHQSCSHTHRATPPSQEVHRAPPHLVMCLLPRDLPTYSM